MANSKHSFYPWTCWSVVAVFYLMQYGLLVFPSAITPDLQQSFQVTATEIGILYSAFLYTYVVMQIPVGFLFDKYSTRKLLFFPILLLALGCFLLSTAQDFYMAVLSRMIIGLSGSFAFVGAIYIGRSWFSLLMFPIIVGLTEAASGIGSIGFTTILAGLSHSYGWRTITFALAIFSCLLALFSYVYVRDKPIATHRRNITIKEDFKLIVKNKRLWLISLYTGFAFVHFMVMANLWDIPFLEIHYRLTTDQAALENSLVIIGFTIGCPLIGYLTRFFSEIKIMLVTSILQTLFRFLDVFSGTLRRGC